MQELRHPDKILTNFHSLLIQETTIFPSRNLKICETILITHEILDWFYTNKKGVLKRRSRNQFTDINYIYKSFIKISNNSCDVVARLITYNHLHQIVVEYFDRKQLSNYFFTKKVLKNSLIYS